MKKIIIVFALALLVGCNAEGAPDWVSYFMSPVENPKIESEATPAPIPSWLLDYN